MEELRKKVIEHEHSIDKMTVAIESLAESSKDANSKLSEIATSMGKQELILEKISNMEEKYRESISRLHKRIDESEDTIEEKVNLRLTPLKEDVTQLKSDRTWVTRVIIGKVILIILGGLYMFNKG